MGIFPNRWGLVTARLKLVGAGAVGAAMQGKSVSISSDGNTAIIGGNRDNSNKGAVWVYTRSGSVWTQQGAKLVGTGANFFQGSSVSISADGNTAIVGGADHLGGAIIYTRLGGIWSQQGEIRVGASQQNIYVSISEDGNTAIVVAGGSTSHNEETTIYTRSSGVWSQQGAKLEGTGPRWFNYIGGSWEGSVSISSDGNTAIVGIAGDNLETGAAWVFTRSGEVWTQQGSKLTSTGGSLGVASQGRSISISADGNTAIVGGNTDNSNVGAAWIYTRSGGAWTQQGEKLVGTGAVGAAWQGASVAISSDGNTAIVGGNVDNSNVGAAWIYTRSGGAWTQQGEKLVGTMAVGAARQGFSVAISSDGNTALVGGIRDNESLGAVWVYIRSGGVWSQQGAKLVGIGAVGPANQGTSVSISSDGNVAIVGGSSDNSYLGAVWVYIRSGGVWSQQGAKLVGIGGRGQGKSVSISADGNTAIVGTWGTIGGALIYTRSSGLWTQQGSLLVGSGAAGDAYQGSAVSISSDGNKVIIGGGGDNSNTGAAWVFTRLEGIWTQQGDKLVGSGASRANQGISVSISSDGNTAAVGGNTDNGSLGAAWIYTTIPTIPTIPNTTPPPTITSFTPTTAPRGRLVTITGTNFTGATSVKLGDSTYTSFFTVVNSNTITTEVTIGVSGNVSVTTPGGTATLAGFTYCDPVTPAISIVASPSNCSSINFTASSINGGTSPSYQWNLNGSNVGTNSETYTNTTMANNDVVSVEMTFYESTCSEGGHVTSANIYISTVANTWTGNGGSSIWNNSINWSCGIVPTAGSDVFISSKASTLPELTSDLVINNLTIPNHKTLSINGNTLTINGRVSGKGTIKGSSTSNLIIGGAADTLYFPYGGNMLNFTLNDNATATLGSSLNIAGGFFGTGEGTVTVIGSGVLTSNGLLTLKSFEWGTARIAKGNTSEYIKGDVTVERYIPANAKRAWRLLSVPTKGRQTINEAWQENQTAGSNWKQGFGTLITNGSTNWVANGFDGKTITSSLLEYNRNLNKWDSLPTTYAPIQTTEGYFMYIRGDRSKASAGGLTETNETILRTSGTLYQGDQSEINVPAGKFTIVGNIFASPINFASLPKTGGITNTYYLWDPKLLGGVSLGGYQTFSAATDYAASIGGGSDYSTGTYGEITNGQAFFVTAAGESGTIQLTEDSKTHSTSIGAPFRPITPTATKSIFKANLYFKTAKNPADAAITVFSDNYGNAVDKFDALKLSNPGENISIQRGNQTLAIEARSNVTVADTIFLNLKNLQQQAYKMEFVPTNMGATGLIAMLEDTYLNSKTPVDLNSTVSVNFTVDANAASTNNRFKIVLKQTTVLPVSFISIGANRITAGVNVSWRVAAINGIRSYELHRSTDGRNFTKAATMAATGNGTASVTYQLLDANAPNNTLFYKVKSIGLAGENKFSSTVKVGMGIVKPSITVAPNPIEGGVVNLQLKNQPKGDYQIRLVSNSGQLMMSRITTHNGGNSTQILSLPTKYANGNYQFEVIAPDKSKQVQTILINNNK